MVASRDALSPGSSLTYGTTIDYENCFGNHHMFSPQEIDAVLSEAQIAVDSLAQDVGVLPPAALVPVDSPSDKLSSIPGATRILKLQVPVAVRLAERQMVMSEILKLGPGTILEFNRPADSELDLMVNNRQIGCGVAVKVNERFGLRINHLGDLQQRIHSLAG
jgi:flagellar motor switch/type III secretory pathway protein FliN